MLFRDKVHFEFHLDQYSFFPDTIRDWNVLPASIISSAESPEDYVARFTLLVRSRLVFIMVGPAE